MMFMGAFEDGCTTESRRLVAVDGQCRRVGVRRDGPHFHFFRDGRAMLFVAVSRDTVLFAVVPRGFQLL